VHITGSYWQKITFWYDFLSGQIKEKGGE